METLRQQWEAIFTILHRPKDSRSLSVLLDETSPSPSLCSSSERSRLLDNFWRLDDFTDGRENSSSGCFWLDLVSEATCIYIAERVPINHGRSFILALSRRYSLVDASPCLPDPPHFPAISSISLPDYGKTARLLSQKWIGLIVETPCNRPFRPICPLGPGSWCPWRPWCRRCRWWWSSMRCPGKHTHSLCHRGRLSKYHCSRHELVTVLVLRRS